MEKRIINSGFTLVELVIVIAVLAILSAVAIPAFVGVRNNAKVSAAKNSLINIIKECIVAEANLLKSPTFQDIASWETGNSYGDRRGLNFGFTYDTNLNSNKPIKAEDSCYQIAAKSNTKEINGTSVPILPHFEVFFDNTSGVANKNCSVASPETINNNYCDPSAEEGVQW